MSRDERWWRSRRAVAVDIGHDLVLVGRDGVVRRLDGASAELARAVLGELDAPRTTDELVARVEAIAEADERAPATRRAVIADAVAVLADAGAIVVAPAPDEPPRARVAANVVVGISGAIAASYAPALVVALQQRGHAVEVAVTPTAARFVALDALAAIVRREVHASLQPRAAHAPVPHVALARWADLVVVYPASATTIARIAAGDCSELVAAIATTTRAPVVIAPSMNDGMLDAPAVQRNLARLRDDGRAIVHPVPAVEVADPPPLRAAIAAAAPPPSELAAVVDALLAAGVVAPRADRWDAAYRRPLVPWARDDCDADIAAALAEHAPTPRRVLDIGTGLGQIARHAAALGHRVVATDVSDVALALARDRGSRDRAIASAGEAGELARERAGAAADIVWLRDDLCATALAGRFDVAIDRAVLHALPPARAPAWAAALRSLVADGGTIIVKCHRDGVPGATTGYSAAAIAALLGDAFAVASDEPAELPSPTSDAPIAARLVVLQRRARPAR
jgi:SAM-dependent methyltransferase/3-polyprenyl-4-hydroxybenzoate decarboxylase